MPGFFDGIFAAFKKRVRELRHAEEWNLRDLAAEVGIGFTYLSRVENGRRNFGDCPSDPLIRRLADTVDADQEELILSAKRIPEPAKKGFLERPDAISAFASFGDERLNNLITEIGKKQTPRKATKRKVR